MGTLRRRLAGVALAPLCLVASSAYAQAVPPDGLRSGSALTSNTAPAPTQTAPPHSAPAPATLGEVVVTARKTTENVQKAPASIVAVSGIELQKEGVTDPQKLEKVLPSANLRTETAVVQTFIRGVGSNDDVPNVQPAVAFVYNGIVVPRYGTQGLLFDVGSVQVISGPQGTLYGGSAAGGAINLNSAQPKNGFSGQGAVEGGNYGTFRVNAAQDVPAGDMLSLRGAIDYQRHDGYQTRGFDAENKLEGRISALYKPTSNFSALVFFSGAHENGTPITTLDKPFVDRGNPWFTPAAGAIFGNPFNKSLTFNDLQTYVVGANLEWRLGENVFTYIPGYVRISDDYRQFAGDLPLTVHDHENQHSEELRWNRNLGALKLTAGAFYLYDRINFANYIAAPVLPAPPFLLTIPIDVIPFQANTSYAVYGQAVYSVTDRLRVTAGARYSDDQIKAFGSGTVGQAFLPFTYVQARQHPDWKIGVDYDLEPRVLLYGNIQTGYIPQGYAPVPSASKGGNYVPESRLLAFSGGFKSRFFDNRLEINDEAYYYDYLNFQAVDFNTQTGVTTELPAQRSTIYGDEITVRVLLPRDTEFDTGANFMSAHYNEFAGPGFDYSGNQLLDAPVSNVNAGLQHDVQVADLGSLRGRVQTHYESGHYGVFSNAPGTRQGAYTKTDLTVTYTPNRASWSVQAYVDNVENQPVFGALSPGGQFGPASGFLEPPRTYGVRLQASWN